MICPDCGFYRDTPNHEYGCKPRVTDQAYIRGLEYLVKLLMLRGDGKITITPREQELIEERGIKIKAYRDPATGNEEVQIAYKDVQTIY